jgi:hypothetical protein
MRTILKEDRVEIPGYDEIWKVVYPSILKRMQAIKPTTVGNFRRWQLSIYNIKGARKAFFNIINLKVDLYLLQDESQYSTIGDDFNDAEVDPNMQLDENSKVNRINIRIKVGTSQKNMQKDIESEFHHEMTHAYQYYGRFKNGSRVHELRNHATYEVATLRKILNNEKTEPIERSLAILFYYIDPDEFNSRLNAFYNEVKYQKPKKGDDIKNIIVKTKEWRKIDFLHGVVEELKKETNVRKQNKLRVVGNLMNEKETKQKYKDYPTMLTDVIDKYNTLRTNSWNEFYKVVQRMIKYGK